MNKNPKMNHQDKHQFGLQIGLTEEECEVSLTHPQLRQAVGYLAKNDMDLEKQVAFVKWRGGTKHEKLTDTQKKLSKKLYDMIIENEQSLKDGAVKPKQSGNAGEGRRANEKTDYDNAAHPSVLGSPFVNPYTFIPFGKKPKRHFPTPLSIGEKETDRRSGVLELEIQTLSPLLSCKAEPEKTNTEHKKYNTLTIGNEVIVPATGVRGSLRTLMTILTGGTLGHLDESLFLTQDRDIALGPAGKTSKKDTPKNVFLAEVIQPGSAFSAGLIRTGTTMLVAAENLPANQSFIDRFRPDGKNPNQDLWVDARPGPKGIYDAVVDSISQTSDKKHQYKLKLSGSPIKLKGKREGIFSPDGDVLEVPSHLWSDYQGRNRLGSKPNLRKGDLIWIQPKDPSANRILNASEIVSLQWARWGKEGKNLLSLIKEHHKEVLPDSLADDGKVDEITDLFGQIPSSKSSKIAKTFGARIRPENLVFFDGVNALKDATLTPLSSPKPGCLAFYRDYTDGDYENFSQNQPLRGYKVYRNTSKRGESAPWNYDVQPIYEKGRLKDKFHKTNKTCQLLAEGKTGILRITFRDLSEREFALLAMACSVDWRLGGGKPLGLGHCRVVNATMRDFDQPEKSIELFSRPADGYPDPAYIGNLEEKVSKLKDRLLLWHSSQKPIENLFYPRASEENNHSTTNGGHIWFKQNTTPKKPNAVGLQTTLVAKDSKLIQKTNGKDQINPQPLPNLKITTEELLYGYNLHLSEENKTEVEKNNQTFVRDFETFDPEKHAKGNSIDSPNTSQNRESRQAEKRKRGRD